MIKNLNRYQFAQIYLSNIFRQFWKQSQPSFIAECNLELHDYFTTQNYVTYRLLYSSYIDHHHRWLVFITRSHIESGESIKLLLYTIASHPENHKSRSLFIFSIVGPQIASASGRRKTNYYIEFVGGLFGWSLTYYKIIHSKPIRARPHFSVGSLIRHLGSTVCDDDDGLLKSPYK